jgi:tetratricopeptide (TPR) repeat protein
MRNQNSKSLAIAAAAAIVLVSCNPLSKMIKRQGEVNYELTPNPVEMHGDSVEITLNGSFPEKYFNKKVSAVVTPVLVYGDKSESFDVLKLKGEDSEAEGKTIKFVSGGSFSHTSIIPFKEGMEEAIVELRVSGTYKGATKDLEPRKVADGTNITPKLVLPSDKPILGAHNFKKFTLKSNKVEVNYLVNNSKVRSSEMNDSDIRDLKANLKGWDKDAKVEFNNLSISAYASPEGELSKNENLANERAVSAAKSLENLLKRANIEIPENFTSSIGKGEDWIGFKSMMQASDIADKDLIIRVLETYQDGAKREAEIKNLAATYTQVSRKVLPKLRRAQADLVMKHINLTDEEIKALVDSNIDSLDIDQMLYAGTLYMDISKREFIYKKVSSKFASDWRGPNNVGFVYLSLNKLDDAKAEFLKADGISPNNPVVNNNLGVIARLNGDLDGAMEMYNKASGAGSEVNQNKGIVNIMKGDYSSAVSNYSDVNTYNAALANLLNGDNTIGEMIDKSDNKGEPMAFYLKAVAGARSADNDMLINNLKTAISRNADLKEKAKKDIEFIKFRDNADFQSLVN